MDQEQVEAYLLREQQVESEVVRQMLAKKVLKYDDIAADFQQWYERRDYCHCDVEVRGWTAQKIYNQAPQLDGIGVFNFLVTLRDSPEAAEEIISEGFTIR